jgi:hypothetical protein
MFLVHVLDVVNVVEVVREPPKAFRDLGLGIAVELEKLGVLFAYGDQLSRDAEEQIPLGDRVVEFEFWFVEH